MGGLTTRRRLRASRTRLIVGCRNRFVHEYPQIDDDAVYSIALQDAPAMRTECAALREVAGDVD